MPLYDDAEKLIFENLLRVSRGERAPIVPIGFLTEVQFEAINVQRQKFDLHILEQNEILFMGRHIYNSRSKDGYTIDDIVDMIASGLDAACGVEVSDYMSCLQRSAGRADRYGNTILDRAVLEMTSRKPRAELFSVIPKGDFNKPPKK